DRNSQASVYLESVRHERGTIVAMKELASWAEEKQSAYLYRVLAEVEAGTRYEMLFAGLADEAERQAKIWVDALARKRSAPPALYRPDLRTRLVAHMVRLLGTRAMRGILAAMKVRGMSVFSAHDTPGHATPTAASGTEQRHRWLGGGGNLRAAVFGINDGLI